MTERCSVTTPTPMWLAYVLVCQQPLLSSGWSGRRLVWVLTHGGGEPNQQFRDTPSKFIIWFLVTKLCLVTHCWILSLRMETEWHPEGNAGIRMASGSNRISILIHGHRKTPPVTEGLQRSFPIFLFNCRSCSAVSGANKRTEFFIQPDNSRSNIILFLLANPLSKSKCRVSPSGRNPTYSKSQKDSPIF